MNDHAGSIYAENGTIGTIENAMNPSQVISIKYIPDEQAFVTSGIKIHFGEKEILMPAYLVVVDFQLMGTIVSAILEELSLAHEQERSFDYPPRFDALGKGYILRRYGDYMRLSSEEDQ